MPYYLQYGGIATSQSRICRRELLSYLVKTKWTMIRYHQKGQGDDEMVLGVVGWGVAIYHNHKHHHHHHDHNVITLT